MRRPYYQDDCIRRHITRAVEAARARPAPPRTVAPGEIRQYVLERLLGIRFRNGRFV